MGKMSVTKRTLRRRAAQLCAETSLSRADANTVAGAWSDYPFASGRWLAAEIHSFRRCGYSDNELMVWMAYAHGCSTAENDGKRWGATPEQVTWMHRYLVDEDSEIAMSERWFDHLDSGVPPGLMCLLFWAGLTRNKDFDMYLDRWRCGTDIEPELRMLAGLLTTGLPIPPVDAPPLYSRDHDGNDIT